MPAGHDGALLDLMLQCEAAGPHGKAEGAGRAAAVLLAPARVGDRRRGCSDPALRRDRAQACEAAGGWSLRHSLRSSPAVTSARWALVLLICHKRRPMTEVGDRRAVDLRSELDDLKELRNGITAQGRGRAFETWLRKLLDRDGVEPRTAYRPDGEEVDGSFVHGGRVYLLEAKWWANAVPASAIYQFKGKVDGKLVGTIGVFISMSDYGPDTVDAVRVGKELNVILFGRSDIEATLDAGFAKVLSMKLRTAAERGEVFVPYIVSEPAAPATAGEVPDVDATIVVEGARDQEIVSILAERLRIAGLATRRPRVLVAMGLLGLAPVALVAAETLTGGVLVLGDSNDPHAEIPQAALLADQGIETIMVTPGVERWLGLDPVRARRVPRAEVARRVIELDIDQLMATDPEFRALVAFLKT